MSKHREAILYIVFGILTTAVNISSYLLLTYTGMEYKVATTVAWVLSVLFAFVTNKLYVFQSNKTDSTSLLKEVSLFLLARLSSYVLDIGAMVLLIELLHVHDFIAKCLTNVLVIIVNYFASKYVIFKTT